MTTDYLNNLKKINMRPSRVKIRERKEVILNENKSVENVHNKIKDFFRRNPNPKDTQINDLAKEMGMEEPELENHIYMVLTDYMNKVETKLKEMKLIQELFVQAGEIEAMPAGKERDLQMARLSMIAEIDAVSLYTRFSKLASDKRVSEIMLDVANEEKVHVGEFEALVEFFDPTYEKFEEEGSTEVEDKTGISTK